MHWARRRNWSWVLVTSPWLNSWVTPRRYLSHLSRAAAKASCAREPCPPGGRWIWTFPFESTIGSGMSVMPCSRMHWANPRSAASTDALGDGASAPPLEPHAAATMPTAATSASSRRRRPMRAGGPTAPVAGPPSSSLTPASLLAPVIDSPPTRSPPMPHGGVERLKRSPHKAPVSSGLYAPLMPWDVHSSKGPGGHHRHESAGGGRRGTARVDHRARPSSRGLRRGRRPRRRAGAGEERRELLRRGRPRPRSASRSRRRGLPLPHSYQAGDPDPHADRSGRHRGPG